MKSILLFLALAATAVGIGIATAADPRYKSAAQSFPCGGDDEGAINHGGAVVRRCYDDGERWSSGRSSIPNGGRSGGFHGTR
jgi:hypothetical protein